MADFPWDKLKAETLRSICSDLGYPRLHYTKEVMLSLLKVVQESGFEKSLECEKEIHEARKEEKFAQPHSEMPSSAKRTRGAVVVSDYDTRHKRKRISDPGPRLSRRKSAKALATASDESHPKRARGRLPKNKAKTASKTKATAPSSTRREIFDGVVLSAPRPNSYKGKEKAEEHHDDEGGDEDAEGDVDMEHEDDGLFPDTQVESSLASSNKENEFTPDESSHTDPSEDQPVPDEPVRDDNDSRPAVLGNMTQQSEETQSETAVLPMGEEVVAEGWTAVVPEVAPLGPRELETLTVETHQTYVHGELTAEDVSNVEEVLRAVAANGL